VVVAVVAVRVVQAPIDKIVHMIAMRHGRMAARRAMLMPVAMDFMRAAVGVLGRDFDPVVFFGPCRLVDEVAVLQIVDVIAMANRSVSAGWTVLMTRAWH